jgi:superfamily I DNA and/or RNA helicase
MVGDHKQLSAITFSDAAKRAGYGRSLFERLIQSGLSTIMLDTQYRMDPIIRCELSIFVLDVDAVLKCDVTIP